MRRTQRKLVVVANRGPMRTQKVLGRRRWVRSAGGLVTALDAMLRVRGGVWVSAEETDDEEVEELAGPGLPYGTAMVRIPRAEQEGFYRGVSNAVLWPLLHGFPTTIRVSSAPWKSYVSANKAFAKVTLHKSEPRDLVWVHDYHLMLVPALLRHERPKNRIGWFCHVPWPNADMFEILPWRREILDGLLGADVVGFHTKRFVENFLSCVERLTKHRVDKRRHVVKLEGREVRVITAPIGVPTEELGALSRMPEVIREAERIRELTGRRKLILGVDRLDYTKGIPERILAWQRFLERQRNPEERFVYVQVMVPSRTDVQAYADLKAEIDRLVGSVNGHFSKTGLVPIHYFYRNLDRKTLFAHYLAADVALVTPLRDGSRRPACSCSRSSRARRAT